MTLGYGTEVGKGTWGFVPEYTEVPYGTLQNSWGALNRWGLTSDN